MGRGIDVVLHRLELVGAKRVVDYPLDRPDPVAGPNDDRIVKGEIVHQNPLGVVVDLVAAE